MSHPIAKCAFATIDIALLVTVMFFISGGHVSIVMFSAPLLFAALTVFLANLYFNLFQDDLEESEIHDAELRMAKPAPAHREM